MNYTRFITIAALSFSLGCGGQIPDLTPSLYETYEKYREPSLEERRIKHEQLQPLITSFRKENGFKVSRVGQSIEGRDLSLISVGSGSIDVFLWSQMHGDEPTATQAIFDILNFLKSEDYNQEKAQIFNSLTLHFLPMLNPDGAAVFQRRNTLGIDVNRDALRLQTPEGRTLKRVRDSLEAEFGFNLHDQSIYYNAERTPKPATISYLAPAYNYEKEINEVRANAMRVIVFMNNIIQQYAPGQVGRYNDDFEPRAFGDNIQKWGTSTILIESGGYTGDREKQEIRKLNYVSILAAIFSIANGSYKEMPLSAYEQIPQNNRQLFDLLIRELSYELKGETYLLDLGIHRMEIDMDKHSAFWYKAAIADQGDLSTFYGYETLDAKGYTVKAGQVYPETLPGPEAVRSLDAMNLLRKGYTYVRVTDLPRSIYGTALPLTIIDNDYKVPGFHLNVGVNPTFVLQKDGQIRYAVVNGFLIDLQGTLPTEGNALILR